MTADPAPGMQPDVICPAEHLPFADSSFDLVVTRIAPHHFSDIALAVAEMARVARARVIVEDTLWESERMEEAERLRDPTHVRSYSEHEWRSFLEAAGLTIEEVEVVEKRRSLADWLARAGTSGRGRRARARADRRPDRRRRVRRPQDPAERPEGSLSGDHRRPRHEAPRPGPDGLRGLVPRAAQQALRHPGRRGRHPGQGRPGRRGRARLRHGRRGHRRDGCEHDDGLRPGALRRRRDLRGGRRRHRHRDLHRRGPARPRDAARLHVHPAEGRDDARPELPRRALAGQGERRHHPRRDLLARARSGSSPARAR